MADDDERALEALQPVLEPLDRAEVEMVGRLVEQQHVRLLRERAAIAARRRSPPLAVSTAGSGRCRSVGDGRRLMRLRRVGAVQHPLLERGMAGHDRILFQQHDLRSGDDRAFAFVGIDQAGEAFEQRGLAGTVAADQREPVALPDIEVELTEQPAFALDQAKVFVG